MPGRAGMGRAILVVEAEPYLWAALQNRLGRATAYVRSAAPNEIRTVWEACRPWPWIVVGAVPDLPLDFAELLRARPVPVHWLGRPPAGMTGPSTAHETWLDLVNRLAALDELALNGVRLLRNRGVVAPDGRIVLDVPEVEGLLAAPDGLPVDPDAVAAELAAGRLPLRIDRRGARVRLEAAA